MSALPRSKVPQRSRGRAAGQPVALRRPPIHLIQLSARSFAMGGLIYRSGLGRRVEGRSPCRGQVPCRRQVAVSRLRGNHNFQKNWLTFASTYIGPIKMSAAKKKRGMVQLPIDQVTNCRRQRSCMAGRGLVPDAGDANGARMSSRIENGKVYEALPRANSCKSR